MAHLLIISPLPGRWTPTAVHDFWYRFTIPAFYRHVLRKPRSSFTPSHYRLSPNNQFTYSFLFYACLCALLCKTWMYTRKTRQFENFMKKQRPSWKAFRGDASICLWTANFPQAFSTLTLVIFQKPQKYNSTPFISH
jgi:hypothetical protein